MTILINYICEWLLLLLFIFFMLFATFFLDNRERVSPNKETNR